MHISCRRVTDGTVKPSLSAVFHTSLRIRVKELVIRNVGFVNTIHEEDQHQSLELDNFVNLNQSLFIYFLHLFTPR